MAAAARATRMAGATGRASLSSSITVDHDEIRRWVEKHGGHPAAVARTRGGRGKSDPGILRIDFPAGSR